LARQNQHATLCPMNILTTGIGTAAILFGLYTAYARIKRPHIFKKLEPMKKFWGETLGVAIHFFGYTVVPLVGGIVIVIAGINGINIF